MAVKALANQNLSLPEWISALSGQWSINMQSRSFVCDQLLGEHLTAVQPYKTLLCCCLVGFIMHLVSLIPKKVDEDFLTGDIFLFLK